MISILQQVGIAVFLIAELCYVVQPFDSIRELPYCIESNKDSGFVLISTLDGKLTSIDSYGLVLWEIDSGPGALLASSIHNVELTNNGEWVRIIPSLSGSLYKFNGKTIDVIPINADNLLKSSFMYSNDLVIAGGREVRTFGVAAKTGDIIYECSSDGCTNKTSMKDEFDDILVIERSTTTVRAHEPRTGAERWNFSVGYHNVKIPQVICLNLDSAMNNLNFTAVVPKGELIATSASDEIIWQHMFKVPIVKVWKWNGRNLIDIDLFTPIKPGQSPLALSPAIYLGMHNKQLYIHESRRMMNALELQIHQSAEVIESKSLTHIPWKPFSATEFEEYHDDSTALSVLYSSEYINGNGYYFYTELDILCDGNSTKRKFAKFITGRFYWKEIVLIIITAIGVNIFWNYGSARLINIRSTEDNIEDENLMNQMTNIPDSPATTANIPNCVSTDRNDFLSRYIKDFDTVRCLGQGGYGVVFEVKQKIDECGYAIKRIALSEKVGSQQRVLREVKALAKLDHPNIVRYCTSWVECPPPGWSFTFDNKWMGDMSTMFSETSGKSMGNGIIHDSSSVVSISDGVTFERDIQLSDQIHLRESSQESAVAISQSSITHGTNLHNSFNSPNEFAYLYIQMQLCQKESLKDWLTVNPLRQRTAVLHIFNQIVSAVEYIHGQKLIHRDLKPSNVFFSQDGNIKVGDFGLVTAMKSIKSDKVCKSSICNHTKGAGTYLYMSPEQMEGAEYDYKVDIFSLGIILFELLVPFCTQMERTGTLNSLRHNLYPEKFSHAHPREHDLLRKMLSKDPLERPNANDVREIINRDLSEK